MTNTTFDNFAEKKLSKIFKNKNPIVIQIGDIEHSNIIEIMEAGKQAAIQRNDHE